jgi:hypothetical protein
MIFVNKGIETDTQALTLEIIADECGPEAAKVSVFLVCFCGSVVVRILSGHLPAVWPLFRERE